MEKRNTLDLVEESKLVVEKKEEEAKELKEAEKDEDEG